MGGTVKSHITRLLLSRKRHQRGVVLGTCLALLVSLGVTGLLTQRAQTKSYDIQVLECPAEGNVAHTHNDDCYDADGNLVCPLEERELHTHDESCYTEEKTLVCGEEEGENHTHTDACYETTRVLTCGKEELTEEHVHGPGCFRTVTVENEASTSGQSFVEELHQTDAENKEHLAMLVSVDAPEGALPDNASVQVSTIEKDEAKDMAAVLDTAVKDAFGDDAEAKAWQIVNIAFTNENGETINPDSPVEVKITSSTVRSINNAQLIHVLDEADQERMRTTDTFELIDNVELVNADENDTTEGKEDTLKFSLCSSGLYLLSDVNDPLDRPIDVEHPAQTFSTELEGMKVEVEACEGALPADATVTATLADTDAVTQAIAAALGKDAQKLVAATIGFSDSEGQEIAPEKPVVVRIETSQLNDMSDPTFMNVTEDGVEILDAFVLMDSSTKMVLPDGDVLVFKTDAASTFALAELTDGTESAEGVLTSEDDSYKVTVTYGPDAMIPEGAELAVRAIDPSDDAYASYVESAKGALQQGAMVNDARLLDISIIVDGVEIEPAAPVQVDIKLKDVDPSDTSTTNLIHFTQDNEAVVVDGATVAQEDGQTGVSFSTESFSVYGVVITDETGELSFRGDGYTVKVTYNADAQIPEGTQLVVEDYQKGTAEFEDYAKRSSDLIASQAPTKEDVRTALAMTGLSEEDINGILANYEDQLSDGTKESSENENDKTENEAAPSASDDGENATSDASKNTMLEGAVNTGAEGLVDRLVDGVKEESASIQAESTVDITDEGSADTQAQETKSWQQAMIDGDEEVDIPIDEYLAALGIQLNSTSETEAKTILNLSLVSPGGEELEPSDTVSVQITYDEPVQVEDNQEFGVVHFAQAEAENGKTAVEEPELLAGTSQKDEDGNISSYTVETDSFSIYSYIIGNGSINPQVSTKADPSWISRSSTVYNTENTTARQYNATDKETNDQNWRKSLKLFGTLGIDETAMKMVSTNRGTGDGQWQLVSGTDNFTVGNGHGNGFDQYGVMFKPGKLNISGKTTSSGYSFAVRFYNIATAQDASKADVLVTISDLQIFNDQTTAYNGTYTEHFSDGTSETQDQLFFSGDKIFGPGPVYVGVTMNVKIQILKHGTSTVLAGTFLYGMRDLDQPDHMTHAMYQATSSSNGVIRVSALNPSYSDPGDSSKVYPYYSTEVTNATVQGVSGSPISYVMMHKKYDDVSRGKDNQFYARYTQGMNWTNPRCLITTGGIGYQEAVGFRSGIVGQVYVPKTNVLYANTYGGANWLLATAEDNDSFDTGYYLKADNSSGFVYTWRGSASLSTKIVEGGLYYTVIASSGSGGQIGHIANAHLANVSTNSTAHVESGEGNPTADYNVQHVTTPGGEKVVFRMKPYDGYRISQITIWEGRKEGKTRVTINPYDDPDPQKRIHWGVGGNENVGYVDVKNVLDTADNSTKTVRYYFSRPSKTSKVIDYIFDGYGSSTDGVERNSWIDVQWLPDGKASIIKAEAKDEAPYYDNSKRLEGAQFTLYSNAACTQVVQTVKAGLGTTGTLQASQTVNNPATSDANGVINFTNLECYADPTDIDPNTKKPKPNPKVYYMKETDVPENHQVNNTIYKVEVYYDHSVVSVYRGSQDMLINGNVIPNRGSFLVMLKKVSNNANTTPLNGAVFALYNEDPSKPGAEPIAGHANLTTGAAGEAGVVRVGNLKIGSTYWLKETTPPEDYKLLPNLIKIEIEEDGNATLTEIDENGNVALASNTYASITFDSSTNTFTIQVKNTPEEFLVYLKKVSNANETPLNGAVFALYNVDPSTPGAEPIAGHANLTTGAAGEAGVVRVGNLKTGKTYWLVETAPPPGYNQLTSPISIKVSSNGVAKVTASTSTSCTFDSETNTFTIEVANNKGEKLPMTGGMGTTPFATCGLAVIGAAIAYGLFGLTPVRKFERRSS